MSGVVVPNRDSEGTEITRIKMAKAGWTYNALPIEFRTSEIDSLICANLDGSNKAGISLKFYDGNDDEITEEGLLEVNETNIVKTVIDFEPPYDYEVIGGHLAINQDVGEINDCRLWIVAVPDIPAPTGSKEMASGINMKFLNHQTRFEVDGRVAKYMTYSDTLHTNKLRFVFVHSAGLKRDIQIVIEHYKA